MSCKFVAHGAFFQDAINAFAIFSADNADRSIPHRFTLKSDIRHRDERNALPRANTTNRHHRSVVTVTCGVPTSAASSVAVSVFTMAAPDASSRLIAQSLSSADGR